MTTLLRMTTPLGDAFEVAAHDLGPADAPVAVACVGGLHGDELNGVFVLARLASFLADVAARRRKGLRLAARVRIVPAVNVLGLNMRRRTWPFDGTDLNRMFPGYRLGETTQRIASAVLTATREAAARIDVHSSNRDFEEMPQVRLVQPSETERWGARQFGLTAVIEQRPTAIATSTLAHAWRTLGGETYVLQAGIAGSLQLAHCERVFRSLVDFLTRTGTLRGVTLARDDEDDVHVFPPDQVIPIVAAHAGFLVSGMAVGTWIHAGQPIGFVYDGFDGALRDEIKAPVAGLLAGVRRQPLLCEGDLVARVLARTAYPGLADTFLAGQSQ